MKNLALIGAVFLSTNLALAATAEAAGCGTAEVVKGKVEVARGSKAPAALAQGEKVCAGDVVKTAAESRVKLSMEDGNVLNVNPGSSMKIEAYENDPASAKKKVLLNVMYGKMRATVNQKYDGKSASGEPQLFQVKTKSAVAGVRGTDFLTSFSPRINKMEVVTFEGKVEVGQLGPGGVLMNAIAVGAGQKTEATIGQPPAPPKAVPPAELNQVDSGSQTGPPGERPQPSTDAKKGPDGRSDGAKQEPGSKGPNNEGDKRAGKDGNKGEGRAPAADDPGSGSKSASGGGGTRTPSGSGMMMPIDTELIAGGPAASTPGGTMPPPMFMPPVMPVYQPPVCEFCNQAIQTGPARVNIRICLPNQGC